MVIIFINSQFIHFILGLDGTHSGSSYKQGYSAEDGDDSSVVSAFFCPLKLSIGEDLLFENSSPGDSKKCRPLHIEYTKESKQTTNSIHSRLKESFNSGQIEVEVSSVIDMRRVKFSVKINALSTMLDGKCINAIMGNNATTRCRGCGETNKDFRGNK